MTAIWIAERLFRFVCRQGSRVGRERVHPPEERVRRGLRFRLQAARWRRLSRTDWDSQSLRNVRDALRHRLSHRHCGSLLNWAPFFSDQVAVGQAFFWVKILEVLGGQASGNLSFCQKCLCFLKMSKTAGCRYLRITRSLCHWRTRWVCSKRGPYWPAETTSMKLICRIFFQKPAKFKRDIMWQGPMTTTRTRKATPWTSFCRKYG